jgi:hypothetical protein
VALGGRGATVFVNRYQTQKFWYKVWGGLELEGGYLLTNTVVPLPPKATSYFVSKCLCLVPVDKYSSPSPTQGHLILCIKMSGTKHRHFDTKYEVTLGGRGTTVFVNRYQTQTFWYKVWGGHKYSSPPPTQGHLILCYQNVCVWYLLTNTVAPPPTQGHLILYDTHKLFFKYSLFKYNIWYLQGIFCLAVTSIFTGIVLRNLFSQNKSTIVYIWTSCSHYW